GSHQLTSGGRRRDKVARQVDAFFFSSRRRHTRSYGDWSSDVCSSDLGDSLLQVKKYKESAAVYCLAFKTLNWKGYLDDRYHAARSEERRVGKECRSRGSG